MKHGGFKSPSHAANHKKLVRPLAKAKHGPTKPQGMKPAKPMRPAKPSHPGGRRR